MDRARKEGCGEKKVGAALAASWRIVLGGVEVRIERRRRFVQDRFVKSSILCMCAGSWRRSSFGSERNVVGAIVGAVSVR